MEPSAAASNARVLVGVTSPHADNLPVLSPCRLWQLRNNKEDRDFLLTLCHVIRGISRVFRVLAAVFDVDVQASSTPAGIRSIRVFAQPYLALSLSPQVSLNSPGKLS